MTIDCMNCKVRSGRTERLFYRWSVVRTQSDARKEREMRRVLVSLCGALLFTTLLSVSVMAGSPSWQSDLVCDVDWNGTFNVLGSQRPFVAILHPSGDLYISKIFGLPHNTAFQSTIWCGYGGYNQSSAGTTDANGTLAAQRIKGFATSAALGGSGVCAGVQFNLYGYPPSAPPFVVNCAGGFKVP